MNDTINDRQRKILTIFSTHQLYSREHIQRELGVEVSKITVIRDLNKLLNLGFLITHGKKRYTTYQLDPKIFLWSCDIDFYFQKEADERQSSPLLFQHSIFDKDTAILNDSEKKQITKLSSTFAVRKKDERDDIGFKKELERVCIDLSWKSSRIEGNTYNLLETEELILHHREADGHSKKEAQMILNHKDAFAFILEEEERFLTPTKNELIELHTILTKDLDVPTGFRTSLVGVGGTAYRPLDNKWQIQEAVEALLLLISRTEHPYEKTIFAHVILAYIQPFKDGNKRTSRMFSNAILFAHNIPLLSYRSVDEQIYKRALLLFYETNNLVAIKNIMLEQIAFTSENYF